MYLSTKNENLCPHKDMHANIQGSISHNSSKLKTIQMLTCRQMRKKKKSGISKQWNTTQQ